MFLLFYLCSFHRFLSFESSIFFYLSFLKFSLVENNNINSLSICEKFEKQILFIERLLVYFFILNFGFED